jgi:S1-C subfamily serine protease
VNVIDLVVVLAVASATLNGVRVGFIGVVTGVVGTIVGFLVGSALAPPFTRWFGLTGAAQVLVALALIVFMTTTFASFFQLAGVPVRAALERLRLGWANRSAGGTVSFVGSLALVWLLGGLLAVGPSPGLARVVQESAILRELDERLPATPEVVARVQNVLLDRGMPLPFAGFEPRAGSVAPPAPAAVAAAQEAASASTVRIAAAGCGRGVTGSGVVVAPGVVMTNAHVIAGGRDVEVRNGARTHAAVPVLFDPRTDIAVLVVAGLAAPPLPIAERDVGVGDGAAVIGYPGGGPLVVTPAAVISRQRAVGRDIWGTDLVRRDVYVLQAAVRSGDSGGPFVDQDGTVLGIVFARSVVQDEVGYALTASEMREALGAALPAGEPVGTGSCAR